MCDSDTKKRYVPISTDHVKGGVWNEYKNIDMCGQGDVELIQNWTSKYSIDELKRYVVEKDCVAISLSPGERVFNFAAVKKFNYQLKASHCKPSKGYQNTLYIYTKYDTNIGKEYAKNSTGQARGGVWTEYNNMDMCGQGDVELVQNWTSKYSLEELKRYVVEKNCMAISLSPGNKSFNFAAIKNFNYQLKHEHCKPSKGYQNTLYIYTKGDTISPVNYDYPEDDTNEQDN